MKSIRCGECGDYSKLRLVEVPEPDRANDREMLGGARDRNGNCALTEE